MSKKKEGWISSLREVEAELCALRAGELDQEATLALLDRLMAWAWMMCVVPGCTRLSVVHEVANRGLNPDHIWLSPRGLHTFFLRVVNEDTSIRGDEAVQIAWLLTALACERARQQRSPTYRLYTDPLAARASSRIPGSA